MAPFKPGDVVYSKAKPHRKGVIVEATTEGRKHEWYVKFETEQTREIKKSQQLLRKNPADDDDEAPAANAHLPVEAAAPPLEETNESYSHTNDDDDDDDDDDGDDLGPRFQEQLNLDDSNEEKSQELDEFDFPDDSTEEEVEEDPPTPPEDYIFPPAGSTVDALGEPVEEDVQAHGEIDLEAEDVHHAKWQQYLLDKAQLLLDGWIVIKTGGNNGITIGSIVSTKGAVLHRRQGIVEGQTDVDGRKLWLVDLGGGQEPMRPQQLLLVNRNDDQVFEWKLVQDSEPETPPPEEYERTGLIGINFPELFSSSNAGAVHNLPYLKLLQKIWPGDWEQHLHQINQRIAAENALNHGKKNYKAVNPLSKHEWWRFIGIIISAGPQCKGGSKLWEKDSHREGFCITHPVNYGPDGLDIMAYYRFNEIKAVFPWSFQDKMKAPTEDNGTDAEDPWHMCMLMVDGFNKNRHDWVAASVRKILDESMSAYRPRTSKTGGYPHLSFILRKPEPLGTEFKTIACSVTGKKSSPLVILLPFVPLKAPWSVHLVVCNPEKKSLGIIFSIVLKQSSAHSPLHLFLYRVCSQNLLAALYRAYARES
jgi:hypothetical protein